MNPRILGIVGRANSGKDTAADFISEVLEVERIAFADPIKRFAAIVFEFSSDQLYGPSHLRNAVDERYSFDPPSMWERPKHKGLKGWFSKLLDQFFPSRLQPRRHLSQEQILRNRDMAWMRFTHIESAFLDEVAFGKTRLARAQASVLLRQVLSRILDDERNITPRLVLQLIGTEFGREVDENVWINIGIRRCLQTLDKGITPILTDIRFVNEARRAAEAGAKILFVARPSSSNTEVGIKGHQSEAEVDSDEMLSLVDSVIANDSTLEKFRERVRSAVSDA